jgi:hypothetical protein
MRHVAQRMGQSVYPLETTCTTTEKDRLKTLAIVRLLNADLHQYALGAGSRTFKSCRPDLFSPMKKASSAMDWPFFVSSNGAKVGQSGQPVFAFRILSNALRWASRSAVITCEYVSRVIFGDAWPRIFDTTGKGTLPEFSSIVAAV